VLEYFEICEYVQVVKDTTLDTITKMVDSTNKTRKWLEKRLGDFLGFQDDSLSEVLDHLQSIENEGDLLDYLEQLLGSRDEDVRVFVKDVGRYRQNLPLLVGISEQGTSGEVSTNSKPPPADIYQKTIKEETTKGTNQKKTLAKAAVATSVAPNVTTTKKSPPVKSSKTPVKAESRNSNNSEPSKPTAAPLSESNEESKPPPPKIKYGLPPKGKAKRICGCFGTFHKPLTNCLYCGRISCVEEGYDFCPFCGYLVEEVKPPEGESSSSEATKAWQHKERLLRYDRDSTQRTLVLDDQADYYSNQTSSWLTEDEQANAEIQDDEERSNLHQRKKQTLNIAF
jgi:activating signal cointegrator 1